MSNGKVRSVTLKIGPSGSPDVVSYNLYYVDTGNVLDFNSSKVDLGKPAVNPDDGKMHIDVSKLVDMNNNPVFTDGRYDIGATAVDDAGNESAMVKKLDVPFDFVAPDAPSDLEIVVT
jgi:hypothetical protein